MKAMLVLVATVALLVGASSAQGSPAARDPRVPALQRQVQSLQRQVVALTQATLHDEDLNTCRFSYQSHFNYGVLNLFATLIGSAPITDQTPSDNGACSRVGINPPTRELQSRSPLNAAASLLGLLVAVR